ncbi:hypothetical protein [Secundilactobacillus kimchicus]|uniref:hypothetical protein n=1 Tax=Secundilactobacillus kimchicus TaxID=528209 RepID=UPI0006D0D1BE|nr:hypothetical protein [Secundilactobacillus kimchicus]MBT9671143.1 hypothetical protein [Secundilactobacillus kimchicus]
MTTIITLLCLSFLWLRLTRFNNHHKRHQTTNLMVCCRPYRWRTRPASVAFDQIRDFTGNQ